MSQNHFGDKTKLHFSQGFEFFMSLKLDFGFLHRIILDSSYSYSHLHQISFFIESHYEWQNVNEGVTGMGPYAFVL